MSDATWHHQIIAGIVASYSKAVYVEIGVLQAECWNVVAPHACEAHGVDPAETCRDFMQAPGKFWHMTSDNFFAEYNGSPPDVIFIDGEHVAPYPDRDADNALKFIADNGTVILHDSQPGTPPNIGLCGHVYQTRQRLEDNEQLEVYSFRRFPGLTLIQWP
jgi:hypothetical protein